MGKTLNEGILSVNGVISGLGTGALKHSSLSSIDSKALNIKEITEFLPENFSVDLQSQLAILPLQYAGQNLPLELSSGTKLPPELLERLTAFLSDPEQSRQLGLTETQLSTLKNAFQNAIGSEELRLPSELVKKLEQIFDKTKITPGNTFSIDETDHRFLTEVLSDVVSKIGAGKNRLNQTIPSANQNILFTTSLSTELHTKADSTSVITPLTASPATQNSTPQQVSYLQSVSIDTMLSRPQWTEAFNSKVMLLAQGQKQIAHIQINPAELGPVEIRLSVNNDHTSIHFISQHNAVREAIEDAFPRLREMMSQSGINLGDVNVSQHSSSDQQSLEFENTHFQAENSSVNDDTHEGHNADIVQVNVQKGLIDHYI